MSKTTFKQLRAEIASLPISGRGRRYPLELRARIVEHARHSSAPRGRVAREIGIPTVTLARWCEAPTSLRMRRVVVTKPEQSSELIVTTRDGHRVSGLDLAGVAELLRLLGA